MTFQEFTQKVKEYDPDMTPQHFTTKSQAQEWADGLCCGYYIEHI